MSYPEAEFADDLVAPVRRWAAHGFRIGFLDAYWGAGTSRMQSLSSVTLPSARFMAAFRSDMGIGVPDAEEAERRLDFMTRACDTLRAEERRAIDKRFRSMRRGQLMRFALLVSVMLGCLSAARLGHDASAMAALFLAVLLSIVGHRAVSLTDAVLGNAAFHSAEDIVMPWRGSSAVASTGRPAAFASAPCGG